MMTLREHPLMSFRGLRSWPPALLGIDTNERLAGENGVLAHVLPDNRDKERIFLLVEHDKRSYVGLLKFDDLHFCRRIYEILTKNTGRSLREVGDLDLLIPG